MKLLDKAMEAERKPDACEFVDRGDDGLLTYYGTEIKTVDELITHAGIDLAIWQVIETKVNNWEVTGKRSGGQDGSKRWLPETLWKSGNRQISVKLKRLAPKPIQEGIRELLRDVKPLAVKAPPKPRHGERHMLEIGLFDQHMGKLCWGEETGTNYDMRIAEKEFCGAIDAMLARAEGFAVEKILFPIGNDFFHVDDWLSQTANGTRVESVDDRFSKVFRIGCRSVQYAIERCLKVAPVEVIWVPGNHDRHTSWFLVEWLAAMFARSKHVEIDNGPRERKYRLYGPSLLGYVHGDEIKMVDLPNLMATEAPDLWAKAKFRSWRLGHWHKRKEMRHTAGDTFNGVEIRIFSSLCGTDGWHYRKGFTGNARMAECHLWSKENGPVGHFVINAQEPSVKGGQNKWTGSPTP